MDDKNSEIQRNTREIGELKNQNSNLRREVDQLSNDIGSA